MPMQPIRRDSQGSVDCEEQSANSKKTWLLYLSEAQKQDRFLTEGWQSDMNGILIFAGLFSATVTSFIIESYKNLRPDDANVVLLGQISLQLTAMASNGSYPAPTPIDSSNLSPISTSEVIVNALWFLSLALSLTSALAATLVDQWSRNYLEAIDSRRAPNKRARIRAYLHDGLTIFGMPTVANVIPLLLHASLFLFLSGLVIFMHPINRSIAYIMLVILCAWSLIYSSMTILPIFFTNCPYRTPLSNTMWKTLRSLRLIHRYNTQQHHRYIPPTMAEARRIDATEPSPARDLRDVVSIRWALNTLTEDNEVEDSLESLPSLLRNAKTNTRLIEKLVFGDKEIRVGDMIVQLLAPCANIPSIYAPKMQQRATTCMKAIWALVMASLDLPVSIKNRQNRLQTRSQLNPASMMLGRPKSKASREMRWLDHALVSQLHWLRDQSPELQGQASSTLALVTWKSIHRFSELSSVVYDDLKCISQTLQQHRVAMDELLGKFRMTNDEWQHTKRYISVRAWAMDPRLLRPHMSPFNSHDAIQVDFSNLKLSTFMQKYQHFPREGALRRGTIPAAEIIFASGALERAEWAKKALSVLGTSRTMGSQSASASMHGSWEPWMSDVLNQMIDDIRLLQNMLSEAEFDIFIYFVSDMLAMSGQAGTIHEPLATLETIKTGLCDCSATPVVQSRVVDLLEDAIQPNSSGLTTLSDEIIDIIINVVVMFDDEASVMRARDCLVRYLNVQGESKTALEALVILNDPDRRICGFDRDSLKNHYDGRLPEGMV